jgi:hypothetical protein
MIVKYGGGTMPGGEERHSTMVQQLNQRFQWTNYLRRAALGGPEHKAVTSSIAWSPAI